MYIYIYTYTYIYIYTHIHDIRNTYLSLYIYMCHPDAESTSRKGSMLSYNDKYITGLAPGPLRKVFSKSESHDR